MNWTNGVSALYEADAREIPLPDASVHCVVTSPPYWGLRDYGLGQWEGGDAECGHKPRHTVAQSSTLGGGKSSTSHQQEGWTSGACAHCGAVQQAVGIGLESTLGEWVANIVAVMCGVRRALRDDGTVWLNLGDSYSSGASSGFRAGSGRADGIVTDASPRNRNGVNFPGLAPKNLIGQPWRVAFALQDDGWILRSAIVWHKPNPMPESVTDRPTGSYEMVFLMTKQGRYFYDAEAVRAPSGRDHGMDGKPDAGNGTANARNVWTIPTQGRPDAHFATFPDELPRRCILAGTSEHGVCGECGAPWARVVKSELLKKTGPKPTQRARNADALDAGSSRAMYGHVGGGNRLITQTLGWRPACACDADVVPATVLDPFVGSGTTVAVAQALGRRGVGLDLNPEYLAIAAKRIGAVTLPLTPEGVLP